MTTPSKHRSKRQKSGAGDGPPNLLKVAYRRIEIRYPRVGFLIALCIAVMAVLGWIAGSTDTLEKLAVSLGALPDKAAGEALRQQARLLTPLIIKDISGTFSVPCSGAYTAFCRSVHTYQQAHPDSILPANLFDKFPDQTIFLSLKFFRNDKEMEGYAKYRDDKKTLYSIYFGLPLIAGNDSSCGIRIFNSTDPGNVTLSIYKICSPILQNNYGNILSYLDLKDLQFATTVEGNKTVGNVQVNELGVVYGTGAKTTIGSFKSLSGIPQTLYVTKYPDLDVQKSI